MQNINIQRDLDAAASIEHDLVVVGGGIYGVMVTLEAARRGLKTLLLERADFGGATSFNSLRIVHGGLRYLQSMDFPRLRESVGERRWHLATFPSIVEPLSCVMPLYGDGLKRPSIFRVALWMNDLLSSDRNHGLRHDRYLPRGKILSRHETLQRCPHISTEGLQGSGQWFDAIMLSSERVLIESLRWATASGAQALNYVEAIDLESDAGKVVAVQAIDASTGSTYRFATSCVINCAGPWCRTLAGKWDRDHANLFRPSLAFNLLFDHDAISSDAFAVSPKNDKSRAYFAVPWKGKLFAGTYHVPWSSEPGESTPNEKLIQHFIDGLNESLPGVDLTCDQVRRVYAGQLPAETDGSRETAHKPVLIDHEKHGGASGLFSVSGVKWTTARDVAAKTVSRIFNRKHLSNTNTPPKPFCPQETTNLSPVTHDPAQLKTLLTNLIESESVIHLDDLLLRRVAGLDDDASMLAAAKAGFDIMQRKLKPDAWPRLERCLRKHGDAAADTIANNTPNLNYTSS